MKTLEERTEFLTNSLSQILADLPNEVSDGGRPEEPIRLVTLLGVALLLRELDLRAGPEATGGSRLVEVQDHGQSAFVGGIAQALAGIGHDPELFAKVLEQVLTQEVQQHGDARLRFTCKRMERLAIPPGTSPADRLLGRALHALVEATPGIADYTNRSVAKLMSELALRAEHRAQICDPFFGVGLLAFTVALGVAQLDGTNPVVVGQELSRDNWLLATLLAAVYGFECHLELGDTLREPRLQDAERLQRHTMVISEPPMGGRLAEVELFDRFSRFPEASRNADLLMLQHITATLAEQGRAVVLVSPNVLFAKGTAARMRSRWIQEDLLESVIALPAGLWQPTTNVPPVILVFNKQKSTDKRSFVSFVQVDGEPIIQTLPRSRGRKVIREEAILQLAEMMAADLADQWPRDGCRVSIQGFVVEDELEEFARADFDLSPSRYIEAYEHAAHWLKVEGWFLEEVQAAASFRAATERLDQIIKRRWADMDKGD